MNRRIILLIFGVVALMFISMLIVDNYKARRSHDEFLRMNAVKIVVKEKLDAYYEANGRYPDSIDVLSFTNSPQEIGMQPDLKKIYYRRTASHYTIGWDGEDGSFSR